MKKILFVAQSLKVGGVERALVEQVNYLSNEEDVTLFLFSKTGEYLDDVDKKVKLIFGNFLLHCMGKTRNESKINPFIFLVRNGIAFLVRLFGRRLICKCIFFFSRKFTDYDIVVSYVNDQGPNSLYGGCNQFILSNVLGGKKVSWIHSDPLRLDKISLNDYLNMDLVINVSHAMKNAFDSLNIINKNKSLCVYNRLNIEEIVNKSKGTSPFTNKNIKILTIGRLEELKGVKDLLHIAKKLSEESENFIWYFLGDGILRTYCEEYIRHNRLENRIVLLGNKRNPYPYIANADICVSGSKTETFGISIAEALILKTPVIALKYSALSEIMDGSNGKICQSYNEIFDILHDCIGNVEHINKIIGAPTVLFDYNEENKKQFELIFNI